MASPSALRFDYFAPDANEVAAHAYGIARLYGHEAVDVEHFALALLEKPGRALPGLFSSLSIDAQAVSDKLDVLVQALPVKPAQSPDKIYITLRAKNVIDAAGDESHRLRDDKIDNVHLLLAIAAEGNSRAAGVLNEAGLSRKRLLQAYQRSSAYHPTPAEVGPPVSWRERLSDWRDQAGAGAAAIGRILGRLPGIPLANIPVTISATFQYTLGLLVLSGLAAYLLSGWLGSVFAWLFVACAWFAGLALHEFGHSLAAHDGGDWSVAGSGYFNLNPFRYAFLLPSLIFPAIFFLLFQIGIPGPAMFVGFYNIRTQRARNLTWLAGPIASGLTGLLLGLPFALRIASFFPAGHSQFWIALSTAAYVQYFSMVISLVPLPGLDGYGLLEPYLPDRVRHYVDLVRPYMFLVFLVFFFTPLRAIFDVPFHLVLWLAGLAATPL